MKREVVGGIKVELHVHIGKRIGHREPYLEIDDTGVVVGAGVVGFARLGCR